MPYLTEELNRKIFVDEGLLIADQWPLPVNINDGDAVAELQFLIHLITEIRHIRAEMNVPLSAKPVLDVRGMNKLHEQSIFNQKAALLRLARLADVNVTGSFAKGSARGSVEGLEIGLPLADILDLNAEAGRLEREIESVRIRIEKISKKLYDPNFIAKAPKVVVEENRRRRDEENTRLESLKKARDRLE